MSARSRRALLHALAGTAAALAGCQSDSAATTTRTTTTSTTTTTTSTTTETTTTTEEPEPGALGGDPALLPATAWPLPNRAPSKSAYLPTASWRDSTPAAGWTAEPRNPGDEDYQQRFLQPVVAADTIYAVNALVFGPNVARPEAQYLRAFDTGGEEGWITALSHDDSTSVPSPPAVHEDSVLVGIEGVVHALKRSSGEPAWTLDVGDGIHRVVPTQDRMYVRAHRSITAISDGETEWTTPYEVFPSAMAIGPDTVYLGSSKRITAIEPATGKLRWRQDLPAVSDGWGVRTMTAVPGGVLAQQNSGHVYAYDTTGVEVWRTPGLKDPIATDGTTLYTGTTGSVLAIDVATGEPVWERTCGEIPDCEGASNVMDIAVTDDTVIAALEANVITALDARTGAVQWTTQAPITIEGLAITEDALYGIGDTEEPLVQLTT